MCVCAFRECGKNGLSYLWFFHVIFFSVISQLFFVRFPSVSLWCIKIYVCVFVWYTSYIDIYAPWVHMFANIRKISTTANDRETERERGGRESPRKSHNQYIKAFINLQNKVLSWMRPYALKTQQRRMLSNTLDIGTFYARALAASHLLHFFGCCLGVRCNDFVRCIRVLRESFVLQNIKFYAELMLLLLSKLYSEYPSSNSNNIFRIHPSPPFTFGFGGAITSQYST